MADPTKVHHPVFARLYARLSQAGERRGQAEHRERFAQGRLQPAVTHILGMARRPA